MTKILLRGFSPSSLSADVSDVAEWLPADTLEWMPEGEHTVWAMGPDGKGIETHVIADAQDAARLDAQLQESIKRADRGESSRPYIDFDHDNGEAAGIPTRFFWADGIRLQVRWTSAGIEALRGSTYSYFSPAWIHGEDDHPAALPDFGPIGSLVNTPAFQSIERLAAKHSTEGTVPPSNQNTPIPMDKLMTVLVEAGLLPSAKLEDGEAAAICRASLKTQKESHDAALAERDAKLTAAEAREQAAVKAEAESFVGEAVTAGRIEDKPELRAAWVGSYLKDRDSTKAMLGSIKAPAKKTQALEDDDTSASGTGETEVETLRAELAREKDPVKKGHLCAKLAKHRNGETGQRRSN